jgi:hypothetical protein
MESGVTTPPFAPDPAWEEAQRRRHGLGGGLPQNILQSLIGMVAGSPFGQGVRSSMDALQQDVDSVSRGQMPQQLMRAGEQVMSAYGNPATGVFLPRIPKYASVDDVLNKSLPVPSRVLDKMGEWDEFIPSGEYATWAQTMLENPALGGLGKQINKLRGMLNQMREQIGIKPQVAGVKTMKPGPDTLEGLIKLRAKAQEGIGGRSKLRPAIRYRKTGEVFGGEVGKNHPSADTLDMLMRREGRPLGIEDLDYGFQIPGENPFIPETVAHYISFPEGAMKVADLLNRGVGMDAIIEILKKGKLP